MTEHSPGPTLSQLSRFALKSAIILRDCSFREQATTAERRACRKLMRGQAVIWRTPGLASQG